MGIENFSKLFESRTIESMAKGPEYFFIDGNFYWERLFYVYQGLDESSFCSAYFEYCFKNLLGKALHNGAFCLKKVAFVFDNPKNRGFLKQPRCVQRMVAASKRTDAPRHSARLDLLTHTLKEFLEDKYVSDFPAELYAPADLLDGKISVQMAESDTDDYFFNTCSAILASGDVGDARAVLNLGGDGEMCSVGPVFIASGDSDFLSRFYNCSDVAVVDFENVKSGGSLIRSCYTLCNYALSEAGRAETKMCEELLTMWSKNKSHDIPSWLNEKFLVDIAVRNRGMMSPNDYLTANFYTDRFGSAFAQAFSFLYKVKDKEAHSAMTDFRLAMAFSFVANSLTKCAENPNSPKLRALVQNIIRPFIFYILQDASSPQTNTSEDGPQLNGRRLGMSVFEFLGAAGGPGRTTNTHVVDSFSLFRDILAARVDFFCKPEHKQYIEDEFKTLVFKLRSTTERYAVSSIVSAWLKKRTQVIERGNVYIVSETNDRDVRRAELAEIKAHLEIGTLLTKCAVLYFLSLIRVWYGFELALADRTSFNYRLDIFKLCSSIYDIFTPPFSSSQKHSVIVQGAADMNGEGELDLQLVPTVSVRDIFDEAWDYAERLFTNPTLLSQCSPKMLRKSDD